MSKHRGEGGSGRKGNRREEKNRDWGRGGRERGPGRRGMGGEREGMPDGKGARSGGDGRKGGGGAGKRGEEIASKKSLTMGFNAATAKRNPNSNKRMAIFRNLLRYRSISLFM